jgi:hypothetical protein
MKVVVRERREAIKADYGGQRTQLDNLNGSIEEAADFGCDSVPNWQLR